MGTKIESNVVSILDVYRKRATKTIKYPVIKEKGMLKEVASELRAVPEEYVYFDHEIDSVLLLAAAYDEASNLSGIVTDKTIVKLFQKQLYLSRMNQLTVEPFRSPIEPFLKKIMVDMLERAVKHIDDELRL